MTLPQRHQERIRWTQRPTEIRIRQNARKTLRRASVKPYAPESPASPEVALRAEVESPAKPTVLQQDEREQLELKQCRQLLEAFVEQVYAYSQTREQTLSEMQQVAIELAVAAASHLVFEAIEANQFGIEELVDSAVKQFEQDDPITVQLNPADYELLMSRMKDLEFDQLATNITFQTNSSFERGSCEVQSFKKQTLRSNISQRLANIRKHWLEELDDSQIERRKAENADATLRRFPDRRETA
ncbi:FliH/SctL family protein [Thalassoglobus polymorphus]|uniref:Flagellar assembly protein H n=1 Tax=Thalassoglobus polymorphus TaxID=2527994 RepID=A0A517QMN7_9PLAN|nr:FliH/SctL family protein [Thalassoglobus polymorphus]QDT32817.1 flagellar assembly protein H [Thalassoglobus polymorphus]